MALNPPISMTGIPLRVSDEFILLEREGTEIEVKVPGMKTLSAKGKIFLTSARLVFVNQDYSKEYFKSFDLPLALMRKLDFKQPIFGSNYLELTILPLYGLIPQPGQIKIWFTKGGCDKFLRIFDVAKQQVAAQLRSGQMAHDNDFNQRIRSGHFANNQAYQDPNDPTYVYVEQPANTTFGSTNQYLGDQRYYNNMTSPGAAPVYNPPAGNQPRQDAAPVYPTAPTPNAQTVGSSTGGGTNYPQPPPAEPVYNGPAPTLQQPGQAFAPFAGQGVSIGKFEKVILGGPVYQPVQPGYGGQPGAYPQAPNPYAQPGMYPQAMANPHAVHNNQPGVGYYFGVPIGPTVQRNY